MRFWVSVLIFASLFTVTAQDRDFLTADEADQVRLTQEPNMRLKLYIKFARQRLDLLRQLLESEKAGRSAFIHDTIEDYTRIVETMDTISDDALRRKLTIDEGVAAIAESETEMLKTLEAIEASKPKDMARYRFVLDEAISATRDSLELAQQNIQQRAAAVQQRDLKEKQELEEMMQPKDLEAKRAAERKAQQEQKKNKAPTLRRKGETVPKR
ncbi:MAG: hypothetical protein HUU41_22060 [Bryobacteraceae bacterium]|nr:hypothetical protein [Bryobacterales bacterium]MEB2361802.1 hypothetical protein [Bryobacterales bacterium]NUN03802.1 hypothetical protein [Bryobacteraceae bacterium]